MYVRNIHEHLGGFTIFSTVSKGSQLATKWSFPWPDEFSFLMTWPSGGDSNLFTKKNKKANQNKLRWYCWWFRNPAPVEGQVVYLTTFTGFYTSQVVVGAKSLLAAFAGGFFSQKIRSKIDFSNVKAEPSRRSRGLMQLIHYSLVYFGLKITLLSIGKGGYLGSSWPHK